jgi:hypothetical protein
MRRDAAAIYKAWVVKQPWCARKLTDRADVPAFLKEGAFWGRTINLNMLFGKTLEELPTPTPEEIASGKGLSYERYGKNLFGFPKPGIYTVTATYAVMRPQRPAVSNDGTKEPAKDAPKEWWIGDIQTNSITIQIGEPGK